MQAIIGSDDRDFVCRNDGSKVSIESLSSNEAVLLYFSAHWCPPCRRFTPFLADLYKSLKEDGKAVEVVFVSWDRGEEQFKEYFESMPWLAIPYEDDKARDSLTKQFKIDGIPSLLIFNGSGDVISEEGTELIGEYEKEGFPWTTERIEQLKQERIDKLNSMSLQDLLGSPGRDYVVSSTSGDQVPISELEQNETIGLYFSAHWCPPCRGFTPLLAEVYNKIKEEGKKFEIVFVSSDSDSDSWAEYFSEMPWLALPFDDRDAKQQLSKLYQVSGIPSLIFVNGAGHLVAEDGRSLVSKYREQGFPFTSERAEELGKEEEEKMAALPQAVKIEDHDCEIKLVPKVYSGGYGCDVCGNFGSDWVYHCECCGWDAHPDCVTAKLAAS